MLTPEQQKIADANRRNMTVEEKLRVAEDHLRMNCHDTLACPICDAERRGYTRGFDEAIKFVAEG